MFTILRTRKIAASILLLALVIMLALGYFFRRQSSDPDICVVADIMYLVPDETKIEDLVKPEKFLAVQEPYSIEFTSDWGCVNLLASEKKAKAVIIHHAAADQVNQQELEHLFKRERFVVAGIGVPGKKLAGMVGMPSLTRDGDIYKTSAFYYVFSFWVEGTLEPDDLKKLETADNIHELMSAEHLGTGGVRTSTDSLLTSEESIHNMLRVIGDHLWGVNQ